jgi:hypothetical protein
VSLHRVTPTGTVIDRMIADLLAPVDETSSRRAAISSRDWLNDSMVALCSRSQCAFNAVSSVCQGRAALWSLARLAHRPSGSQDDQ